ncbi:MAG: hypothetical protein EBV73_07615, partial [Rhodocyclales bacterium]|nr:hypothetical protein [Rhodocyclales bacterium]
MRYCVVDKDTVKKCNEESNKNGEQIKVLLITHHMMEGVDFKNIRQLHILKPMTNMCTIEQIIGRAVRGFSHKLLPFEKRNVEIFMYSAYDKESNKETADMYVYRHAEDNAKKIGTITRILKEVAVDCYLNIDQQKYAQDHMDITVKQILSDGQVINDYKIGDVPFSAACDYMSECKYNCAFATGQYGGKESI